MPPPDARLKLAARVVCGRIAGVDVIARRGTFFGFGLLALASCALGADQRLATEAVSRFHRLYNAENYSAIYTSADQAFQNAMSEADYVTFMSAVHRKLGSLKSSADAGWRVSQTLNGTQIALAFSSEFAEGAATEQFLFKMSSGKPSLIGYHINSPLLIIR